MTRGHWYFLIGVQVFVLAMYVFVLAIEPKARTFNVFITLPVWCWNLGFSIWIYRKFGHIRP